jgi:hypothetical protein
MPSGALDKVQFIKGTPPCQPGKCAICGNCGDGNSEFLDIGLELDYYGVVYFCSTCVYGDILKALDLVTREKYQELEGRLTEVTAEYLRLRIEKEELKNALGAVVNNFSPPANPDSEQLNVVETPQPATQNTKPTSRKTTAAKSGPAKQNDESGSKRVQHDDSPEESTDKFDL